MKLFWLEENLKKKSLPYYLPTLTQNYNLYVWSFHPYDQKLVPRRSPFYQPLAANSSIKQLFLRFSDPVNTPTYKIRLSSQLSVIITIDHVRR